MIKKLVTRNKYGGFIMLTGFIIAISALIQGVTSFGFSLVALPLLAFVMPFDQVVPLLVLFSLVLNAIMLSKLYRFVNIKLILMLILGGALGIPIGIYLLKVASPTLLKQMAGGIIVLVASVLISGKRLMLSKPEKYYGPLGLVAGVLQGALSLSGPPIVLFLSNQEVDKMTFRANLTAFFTAMNVISLPGFVISGVVSGPVVKLALTTLPMMVIGLILGMYLVQFLNEVWFKKASLTLMILSGFMAIITA